MSADQRLFSISTIPLSKLSVVMNNFIINTITHLNKLSVKGEEKLAEFDNKLNDLDVMTSLLEAKLNSLPEKITSTYPPLREVQFDDLNPSFLPVQQDNASISVGSGASVPPPPPPPPPPIPTMSGQGPMEANNNKDDANQQEGQNNEECGEHQNEEENLSPEEDLENFLKTHPNFENIYKSLKLGVSTQQLEMKVKMGGFNIDTFNELIEKAKKVHPNIK